MDVSAVSDRTSLTTKELEEFVVYAATTYYIKTNGRQLLAKYSAMKGKLAMLMIVMLWL